MRTRPNFGVIGQAQYKTNTSTGTVLSTSDYVNNAVVAATGAPAQGVDAVAANGGTITYSGNYKIHTYTGSGTFTPTFTGNVEMLLVGGGGGNDTSNNYPSDIYATSGGGSGGMIYYGSEYWINKSGPSITVTAGTTYTVTVGAGGGAGFFVSNTNLSGGWGNLIQLSYMYGGTTSVVGGSINLAAYGGSSWPSPWAQSSGGGGAGSAYYNTAQRWSDGGGSAAPGQGFDGAACVSSGNYATLVWAGGGGTNAIGGGSFMSGQNGGSFSGTRGFGGNGTPLMISGTATYYGGGGQGGNYYSTNVTNITAGQGTGGGWGGGGGCGGWISGTKVPGANGSPNTGGGGGGRSEAHWTISSTTYGQGVAGGLGGSGIVIIRYSRV